MSTTATRILGPTQRIDAPEGDLTIRFATAGDVPAIERLAQLDSRHVPQGRVLVAAVAGEPWAAVSVDATDAVADPFRPTGELVALLHERARQIQHAGRVRAPRMPLLRPRPGS